MSNVAHFWVEQNLGSGDVKLLKKNTGQGVGSNFYWEGDTIYSYGRHFAIAKVVTVRKEKVVLFTRRDYSQTTNGHKRDVRQALRGRDVKVFEVANVDPYTEAPDAKVEKAYFENRAAVAFDKSERARTRAMSEIRIGLGAVTEGNRLSKFFKLGFKLKEPANLKELVKSAKVREKKALAAETARRAAQSARYERERQARLEADKVTAAFKPLYVAAWLRCEDIEIPDGVSRYNLDISEPTLLRVKGLVVETSRGAEVPLADAVKLIHLIKRIKEGAKFNGGIKVGEFEVNSIAADGSLTIGCHRISGAEVDRFIASVGLS